MVGDALRELPAARSRDSYPRPIIDRSPEKRRTHCAHRALYLAPYQLSYRHILAAGTRRRRCGDVAETRRRYPSRSNGSTLRLSSPLSVILRFVSFLRSSWRPGNTAFLQSGPLLRHWLTYRGKKGTIFPALSTGVVPSCSTGFSGTVLLEERGNFQFRGLFSGDTYEDREIF